MQKKIVISLLSHCYMHNTLTAALSSQNCIILRPLASTPAAPKNPDCMHLGGYFGGFQNGPLFVPASALENPKQGHCLKPHNLTTMYPQSTLWIKFVLFKSKSYYFKAFGLHPGVPKNSDCMYLGRYLRGSIGGPRINKKKEKCCISGRPVEHKKALPDAKNFPQSDNIRSAVWPFPSFRLSF